MIALCCQQVWPHHRQPVRSAAVSANTDDVPAWPNGPVDTRSLTVVRAHGDAGWCSGTPGTTGDPCTAGGHAMMWAHERTLGLLEDARFRQMTGEGDLREMTKTSLGVGGLNEATVVDEGCGGAMWAMGGLWLAE